MQDNTKSEPATYKTTINIQTIKYSYSISKDIRLLLYYAISYVHTGHFVKKCVVPITLSKTIIAIGSHK